MARTAQRRRAAAAAVAPSIAGDLNCMMRAAVQGDASQSDRSLHSSMPYHDILIPVGLYPKFVLGFALVARMSHCSCSPPTRYCTLVQRSKQVLKFLNE